MVNPYPYKPVHVRQVNPNALPEPGGYPPPQLPAGYPNGAAGPYLPEGQYMPYFPGQPAPEPPGKAASGLLGNFNVGQIKQLIDRMGGIDGVLNTVGKVQKIVQSVQQIAPMLKLLLPKSAAKTAADEDEWEYERPRRRRRRRPRSYGYRPRPRAGSGPAASKKRRPRPSTGQRRRTVRR